MAEEISFKEEILKLLDRDPFAAFKIVMASGDRYEVHDPHQLAVGESVMILIPPRSAHVFMRLNQVAAIEVSEPVA